MYIEHVEIGQEEVQIHWNIYVELPICVENHRIIRKFGLLNIVQSLLYNCMIVEIIFKIVFKIKLVTVHVNTR